MLLPPMALVVQFDLFKWDLLNTLHYSYEHDQLNLMSEPEV